MDEIRAIMRRLKELKEEEGIIDIEKKALWDAFFSIADQEAGEDKPFRFLDEETGEILARSIRQSQTLDDIKLENLLSEEQWESISILPVPVRMLDQTLLEAAIKKDEIKASIVEECTTVKMIPARLGPRMASKEELAELEEGR